MSDRPYIAGRAFLPIFLLGGSVDVWKKKLTVKSRGFKDSPPRLIPTYDLSEPGFIGMPIDFAIKHFDMIRFEDRTVLGGTCYHHRLPDPFHPNAAEGQSDFMQSMEEQANDSFTVFAKAQTGTGKTAVALRTAALRGRRTLVICTSVDLARQWKTAIREHLGVPEDEVGWVQGDICKYEHPFVVAIAHSIAGHRYTFEFYEAFGTLIYDELHRFGAPLFSETVGLFPASLKIGLSAQDKRKDGCERIFTDYFGEPRVVAKSKAMPCVVHTIKYDVSISKYKESSASIINELVKDEGRNALAVRLISNMFARDRQVLVLGDRTQHLQHLMVQCNKRGIPYERMGLYTNRRYTGAVKQVYPRVEEPKIWRHCVYFKSSDGTPSVLDKLEKVKIVGMRALPVVRVRSLQRPKIEVDVYLDDLRLPPVDEPVTAPLSVEELDWVKNHSQIVFGTYGMLKEGKDIPRLDAGIDVTPRADGEQAIGRIRRPRPGKLPGVWYTFHDVGHDVLDRYFWSRVKDYGVAGAEVRHHGYIT